MLTGGVRTPSDALVGPLAVAAIGSLHLDLLFLGVHGISEPAGFTTPNLHGGGDRPGAGARRRSRLVVLADHTKWDTVGHLHDRPAGGGRPAGHRRPSSPPRPATCSGRQVGELVVAETASAAALR